MKKTSKQPLSEQVIHAGIWAFSLRMGTRLLGFLRIIILARILSPDDFGLMGIALLAMSGLEVFSQIGFERALIQKKGDIQGYLDTAWAVLGIRGVFISLVLILFAPFIASFFQNPEVVSIMRVIAISQIFRGFTNIGVVYFRKELDFKKRFTYRITGAIAEVITAVSLTFILQNVWAIVWGLLAGSITRMVISYIVHSYRPKFNFEIKKAKELFDFGGWIFLLSILVFLLTKGDDVLVGKVLGTPALGFYLVAYRLSNLPVTELAHVVSKVTFPAYSKLQNNLSKLKKAYFNVLQGATSISIPLAGGIFVLAPELTKILLGEKWMPIVPAVRILCIFGAIRSIRNTFGAVFAGVGKPKIGTKVGTIQLGIMGVTIYPLTVKWGILGTALSILIALSFALVLGIYELQRILRFKYIDLVKTILSSIIIVFILSSLFLIKQIPWYTDNLVWLLVQMSLGITIWSVVQYSLNREFYSLFLANLRKIRKPV